MFSFHPGIACLSLNGLRAMKLLIKLKMKSWRSFSIVSLGEKVEWSADIVSVSARVGGGRGAAILELISGVQLRMKAFLIVPLHWTLRSARKIQNDPLKRCGFNADATHHVVSLSGFRGER